MPSRDHYELHLKSHVLISFYQTISIPIKVRVVKKRRKTKEEGKEEEQGKKRTNAQEYCLIQ
jgi:hypothetical protein